MTAQAPHQRYTAHLRTPSPTADPDAGLRGLDHYERRLPKWRFRLRQRLIDVVRWETPHLAHIQNSCRTPFLDSYFAFSANLGTHTFFMTALPICYWCGFPEMGMALIHMLAMGVYLSGYVKDMVCLPRPLSPPLHRITMSGSAALEYGFPSTHTTNAVSVALYCLYQLQSSRGEFSDLTFQAWRVLCYAYAISITLGRMYCGMHGFFDVVAGGFLGALIAWLRIEFGPSFDAWLVHGTWSRLLTPLFLLVVSVRIHPEPADNCPCFDDSVAFVGVVMGISIGLWQRAQQTGAALTGQPIVLNSMYTFTNANLLYPVARILIGIVSIFVWRALAKPILLGYLPPIFRFVDHWGFRLPRRYFLQSRDYKTVPPLEEDDKVIPHASEIPTLVNNLRHPRRRAVSVGPQSEADAREHIANRERQRKDSRASLRSRPSLSTITDGIATARQPQEESYTPMTGSGNATGSVSSYMDVISSTNRAPPRPQLQVNSVDLNLLTPPLSDNGAASDSSKEDEKNDRKLFSNLEKPRIRYDVEVITKLAVYAGIAWLAAAGNPYLFERIGLV